MASAEGEFAESYGRLLRLASWGVFAEPAGHIHQVLSAGRYQSLTRPVYFPDEVNRGSNEEDEQACDDRELSSL